MSDKLGAIADFLGTDNVERIKQEFTDMLLDNIRDSVDRYFLFTPEDIDEDVEAIVRSAQKEVAKQRKAELKGKAMKMFNDYVDKSIKRLESNE